MTDELEEVRRLIAAERGLGGDVLPFMTGSTVAELEASADALARLVGVSGGEEPEAPTNPLADLLARAPAEKARRQRELVAALHPRQQPRDPSTGRYAKGSFDGGARRGVPRPRDPEQEHAQLVTKMARLSRMLGPTVEANVGFGALRDARLLGRRF